MKQIYRYLLIALFYNNSYSQAPCPGIPTVDYSGKTYHTVAIGDQCWLKENLDVGTRIDGISEQADNGTIEKYCYYDSLANCALYGGLYQWKEAMQYVTTTGAKGICPTGWHIPTHEEYGTLTAAVGEDGDALKAVGQGTGSGTGSNTSGFSALLSGYRYLGDGHFYLSGSEFYSWSSTEIIVSNAHLLNLDVSTSSPYRGSDDEHNGFSVRCLNDIPVTAIPVEDETDLPKNYELRQNFPNPFNPNTVISYSIPSASEVKLTIYNSLGQSVKVLENGFKNAGNYSARFNAGELPSGTYYYKIEAGQFTQIKKMILLK